MNMPNIPNNVNDWTMDTINSLLNIPNIESEKLECKRQINNKLANTMCAMANTSGGFIIIGLEEKKSNEKKFGFQKIGLNINIEDSLRLTIGNSQFSIEPLPKLDIHMIKENDKIYPIIQIREIISKKPFFMKNSSICYIRLDNSSRKATRSIIKKLFINQNHYQNIQNLKIAFLILKNELLGVINYLKAISPHDQTRPPLIDMSFIRKSILENQSFLAENDLFGEITEGSIGYGVVQVLHIIGKLNVQLEAYNSTDVVANATDIKEVIINPRYILALDLKNLPLFIDKLITKCDKHLSKYD